MDKIELSSISNNEKSISGIATVGNESVNFTLNKETQEVELHALKGNEEKPLSENFEKNIMAITDSIKEKLNSEKSLPIDPDRLGTYKVPAEKAKQLDEELKQKKIPHRFGKAPKSPNHVYVLFDKKFYPGVKATLDKLEIEKPPLRHQISKAKQSQTKQPNQEQSTTKEIKEQQEI